MRHFVLTRAVYGPLWSLAANQRRLDLLEGITARSLTAQTRQDFTWVVCLGREDPLREQREAVIRATGLRVKIIDIDTSPITGRAPWDRRTPRADTDARERVAFAAYRADWRTALGIPSMHGTLMTRIDDDDAFSPTAFERLHHAAKQPEHARRAALIFPVGIRVWNGCYSIARHPTNAWQTLRTRPGDRLTVYDYGHVKVAQHATVRFVDEQIGWLWVRHTDTLSGWRKATVPLSTDVRAMFPIDWALLEPARAAAA